MDIKEELRKQYAIRDAEEKAKAYATFRDKSQPMTHTKSSVQGTPTDEAYLSSSERDTPGAGALEAPMFSPDDLIGPGLAGKGAALVGSLLQVPWKKAGTRLADLAPYAETLKKAYSAQLRATNEFNAEHGIKGFLDSNNNLKLRETIGKENSVPRLLPEGYGNVSLNPQPYLDRRATVDFHTHRIDPHGAKNIYGSPAQPSLRDLINWRNEQIVEPIGNAKLANVPDWAQEELRKAQIHRRVPGTMRGNQENIVAAPDGDYLWWTLPKDVRGSQLTGMHPEASQEEIMARIMHGAKKGDWDVQTTIDPRIYGVKP